jgi:hypothetical protein
MLELSRSHVRIVPPHFAFGGVAFELESDRPFALSAGFAAHAVHGVTESDGAPLAAHLRCAVRVDPSLSTEAFAGFRITRESEVAHVAATGLRATLRRSGSRADGFVAEARIATADAQAADAVVLGLSAAVIEWRGGLHVHAAALELDGRAVLFVGPSGAGKSTAVVLATGGSALSYDRVSVFARGGQHWVWSQPGGTPTASPWSERRALPLSAVLRVRHGRGRPRIERLRGARSAFALRESVDVGFGSQDAEERRMLAVLALDAAVPIGEIHSVLGVCHTALVREFAASEAREAAHARPQPEIEAHAQR